MDNVASIGDSSYFFLHLHMFHSVIKICFNILHLMQLLVTMHLTMVKNQLNIFIIYTKRCHANLKMVTLSNLEIAMEQFEIFISTKSPIYVFLINAHFFLLKFTRNLNFIKYTNTQIFTLLFS